MSVTFEEIVRAWILDYDDRLPNERKARREAFIILLGNLEDHNYTKEDFNNSRKEKIVRVCVNPYYNNKSKLKKWISLVVNDLDAAMLIYYGTVKIRRDVLTSEMSDKLDGLERRAEETKALKKTDSVETDEEFDEGPLNIYNDSSLDLNREVKEAIKKEEGRELTPEILDAMEGGPDQIIIDEDFEKKIEEL